MEIQASRWYQVIEKRKSRRRYDSRSLEPAHLSRIKYICDNFKPFTGVRAVLMEEPPDKVFKRYFVSIKNAPAYIAFVGDMKNPYVQEQVGYMGEGIILEAESLGLGTCWVGLFQPQAVASVISLAENERVLVIAPIGYATKQQSLRERIMSWLMHRRKPLSDLVTGIAEPDWPQWVRAALEAARLAPSASNRQPWRFYVEPDSITVSANISTREFGISKRLCCGIAMLHIEVAALNCGIKGEWKFLKPPQVARFKVK